MFRAIDLSPTGEVSELDDATALDLPTGHLRWIDLEGATPADLDRLKGQFNFDNIALKNCAEYGQESTIEDYEAYFFVVMHAFVSSDDDTSLKLEEIHAFCSAGYLVTVHDAPNAEVSRIWQRALTDPSVLKRGPSWVLFLLGDAMLSAANPVIDQVATRMDALERTVIEDGADAPLNELFRLKRMSYGMRRVLRPLPDVFGQIARHKDERVSTRTAQYFRDLSYRVSLAVRVVEEIRDIAQAVMNAHHAAQAGKTNEVIKNLTIFSAIFMPLSFIVGFWGQNFAMLPFTKTWAFGVMLGSLVVIPLGIYLWIKHKWQ